MCDPVTIGVAGLVLSAGSTVAGMSAASQQAEAQAAAARDTAANNAEQARIQAEGNAATARANAFQQQIASLLSAQKSQAEIDAAEYNAIVSDNNRRMAEASAESAAVSGASKAGVEFQRQQRLRATQAAAFSANGMDIGAGSPLDVLSDSARVAWLDKSLGEYDAANNVWSFKNQSNDYSAQAALQRMSRDSSLTARNNSLMNADYAVTSGNLSAASAIEGGKKASASYLRSGAIAEQNAYATGKANSTGILLNGVSSMAGIAQKTWPVK